MDRGVSDRLAFAIDDDTSDRPAGIELCNELLWQLFGTIGHSPLRVVGRVARALNVEREVWRDFCELDYDATSIVGFNAGAVGVGHNMLADFHLAAFGRRTIAQTDFRFWNRFAVWSDELNLERA